MDEAEERNRQLKAKEWNLEQQEEKRMNKKSKDSLETNRTASDRLMLGSLGFQKKKTERKGQKSP